MHSYRQSAALTLSRPWIPFFYFLLHRLLFPCGPNTRSKRMRSVLDTRTKRRKGSVNRKTWRENRDSMVQNARDRTVARFWALSGSVAKMSDSDHWALNSHSLSAIVLYWSCPRLGCLAVPGIRERNSLWHRLPLP